MPLKTNQIDFTGGDYLLIYEESQGGLIFGQLKRLKIATRGINEISWAKQRICTNDFSCIKPFFDKQSNFTVLFISSNYQTDFKNLQDLRQDKVSLMYQ